MKILNEGVQMIHIGPNTVLTNTAIQYALQSAFSSRMYAKFYTDKFFIQVNFMRDNTINLSTNITSPAFVMDLKRNEALGWNFGRVKEFIYRWMQISRRSLR